MHKECFNPWKPVLLPYAKRYAYALTLLPELTLLPKLYIPVLLALRDGRGSMC